MAGTEDPAYLGFDLSTQQLKAIIVSSSLSVLAEAKVDFDADFGRAYGIAKGVVAPPGTREVYAPVAMWLEAVDLVLGRLRSREGGAGLLARVRGVSGSCQQHGSVYWGGEAEGLLAGLRRRPDGAGGLAERLAGAFSHPWAPNWQDSSTQEECDALEAAVGGKERLAEITGSSAHHRFTGTQVMRLRKKLPETYASTSRISLVSSFLASVLVGSVAPLDISDVCGMNLWDIPGRKWCERLLALVAGGPQGVADLEAKLGAVRVDGGGSMGTLAPYFSHKYGMSGDCRIAPFTGDNPATLLALPLRPGDAIVSFGTSTTFLTVTPHYKPSSAYHFFNHPTIPGQYMFMLCYKNGGLARETVRDALAAKETTAAAAAAATETAAETETEKTAKNSDGNGRQQAGSADKWAAFNSAVLESKPLGLAAGRTKLGLYFDLPEIVPNLPAGTWRFTCTPSGEDLQPVSTPWPPSIDARAIVESQCLSMRLRSRALVDSPPDRPGLPPQPRRIYLVGGGSVNPAVARVVGDVLGGADGVYRLDVGGNACALGGAYKAAWALERDSKTGRFDDFVGKRWREESAVTRIKGVGYAPGVWEGYGAVLGAFGEMEQRILGELGRP